MKSAVVVFPASNCDRDGYTVLKRFSAENKDNNVTYVWHRDTELPKVDLVYLPGGFSYGDYLRSGAMAARSPIMDAIRKHAASGGYVMGVCNGFQILTEAQLLPGTLMRNKHLKFVCREVFLRVENPNTAFTRNYREEQVINVPVAHHDGCYFADKETLNCLNGNDQVAFRYCDAQGGITEAANPNGSLENIAGIFNEQKNVLGMMPHPERHAETLLGGNDGEALFKSLLAA